MTSCLTEPEAGTFCTALGDAPFVQHWATALQRTLRLSLPAPGARSRRCAGGPTYHCCHLPAPPVWRPPPCGTGRCAHPVRLAPPACSHAKHSQSVNGRRSMATNFLCLYFDSFLLKVSGVARIQGGLRHLLAHMHSTAKASMTEASPCPCFTGASLWYCIWYASRAGCATFLLTCGALP